MSAQRNRDTEDQLAAFCIAFVLLIVACLVLRSQG